MRLRLKLKLHAYLSTLGHVRKATRTEVVTKMLLGIRHKYMGYLYINYLDCLYDQKCSGPGNAALAPLESQVARFLVLADKR